MNNGTRKELASKILADFEEEKPVRAKNNLRELYKKVEPIGFSIQNYRGEIGLYKRYPQCEVVGVGMNTDANTRELKMFCIWKRKDFYRIIARIYCLTNTDVLEAAGLIDDAFSHNRAEYPFDILLNSNTEDIHLVKINGKWNEGVLRYSFSKGWYTVTKEDMRTDEYK